MTAAGANQETDAVVKAPGRGLDGWTLTLAGDGDGVGRSATVGLTLAGDLSAAVWVHAVDQPVWNSRRDDADKEGEAVLTWISLGRSVNASILVLSWWVPVSSKFIKATAEVPRWHESVNCAKACRPFWTFKVLGSSFGSGSSLLAPARSVSTTLHNWSTVYFKACCLTNSSAAAFPYSSDVLCMIDLFCLLAPSPRGHIKANLAQSEMCTPAEVKRLFVQGVFFFLPPSLSLPSEHSISVATSQPRPLHPDWQTQCHTFWSRTHLPLLLHSPGQPSVNISRACQKVIRRKSGGGGCEDKTARRGGKKGMKGVFRVDREGGGSEGDKKNEKRQHRVNIQNNTPLTGLEMLDKGVRSGRHFTWASGASLAAPQNQMWRMKVDQTLMEAASITRWFPNWTTWLLRMTIFKNLWIDRI